MIIIIDHYDSFTDLLADYFRQLSQPVSIVHTDQDVLSAIQQYQPSHLVLSPGPGHPNAVDAFQQAIMHHGNRIPILGVCLGHQAIAAAFGATIMQAQHIMHGTTSTIQHEQQGIFRALPSPLTVTRYHSLIVDPCRLPAVLQITAVTHTLTGDLEIMGMAHRHYPIYGVQFHPEALLTEQGLQLLKNFTSAHCPG